MLLFLMLFTLFILINNFKKPALILITSSLVFFICFFKKIVIYTLSLSLYWNEIYEKNGLWNAITSFRSYLLENAIKYCQEKWSFLNYICGGIELKKYKVEFELVDLYLFLGVFGIAYYFTLVNHIVKNTDYMLKGLFLIIFIVSFFSGGLLLNISAFVFLYVAKNIYL